MPARRAQARRRTVVHRAESPALVRCPSGLRGRPARRAGGIGACAGIIGACPTAGPPPRWSRWRPWPGSPGRRRAGCCRAPPRSATSAREAVLRAADELGYVTNRAARALMTRRSGSVAFVVAEPEERFFADPHFALVLRGAHAAVAEHDVQLVFSIVHGDAERERFERFARAGHLDGVILVSLHGDHPLPHTLAEAGIPVVLLGRPMAASPVSSYVDADNVHGGRLAAGRLADAGRTAPGHDQRAARHDGRPRPRGGVPGGARRARARPGGRGRGRLLGGGRPPAMAALLAAPERIDGVFARQRPHGARRVPGHRRRRPAGARRHRRRRLRRHAARRHRAPRPHDRAPTRGRDGRAAGHRPPARDRGRRHGRHRPGADRAGPAATAPRRAARRTDRAASPRHLTAPPHRATSPRHLTARRPTAPPHRAASPRRPPRHPRRATSPPPTAPPTCPRHLTAPSPRRLDRAASAAPPDRATRRAADRRALTDVASPLRPGRRAPTPPDRRRRSSR